MSGILIRLISVVVYRRMTLSQGLHRVAPTDQSYPYMGLRSLSTRSYLRLSHSNQSQRKKNVATLMAGLRKIYQEGGTKGNDFFFNLSVLNIFQPLSLEKSQDKKKWDTQHWHGTYKSWNR